MITPKITLRHVGTGATVALLWILPMVLIGKAADGVSDCRHNCTACPVVHASLEASAAQMAALCCCLLLLSFLFTLCLYKRSSEYYGGLAAMYLCLACVTITASAVCARFTPSCVSAPFASSSFSTTSLFLIFTIIIMYAIAHTTQDPPRVVLEEEGELMDEN